MYSLKSLHRRAVLCAAFVGLIASGYLLRAQESKTGKETKDNSFQGMKWRLIGPFRGGRVLAVSGIPSDPDTYYFGAVAGGVWKSIDAGLDWTPLFDKEPISSIGAIAVAESDPNVIYVGTGEACLRGDISYGNGVYKSVDAGKTWAHIGLEDSRHIAKVIVDPHNPDVVFVAALGHAYGPNSERGVFRSHDGGKTWEKVLYKDDKTGAIDLTFDPNNAHILYAALYEVSRTPYGLTSGGPGSGLYKSSDGGTTWMRLEGNGLPKGILGRIGIAVSRADSDRVYAQIEAEEGGLYRSDDAGEKWMKINDDHRFRQRAWYFTHVFADPKNVDTVYELNTGLFRSTDGGKSFSPTGAPHGDHHGLWIDPTNPLRMINGNDGGATVTNNGGKNWTRQDSQPTAQFYHVATDTRFPYFVYGAQQDNSTVAIASASEFGAIDRADWYPVGGGESGYVVPYPPDPDIVYAGSYDGLITRYNRLTWQEQDINPWPENPMGAGAAELKHRFQWTAPIAISPHDPNVLYHGAEVLFKSTDGGMTWSAISPDLTRNDKSKQGSSGGPLTQDNTSVEYYDTIFAIAESPITRGEIWVGSDDGLVHLTLDGGKTWSDMTPKSMPEWSMVSLIEASPHDAASAYLAIDRHRLDDMKPYIYKTGDFGKTWTAITNGIPEGAYVHAAREDPKRKGLLYAGTESGVYVSFDDGALWQSLQLEMPTSPIHDLTVKDDDLVVATHGRAFWILDDITPLRQFNADVKNEAAHLYEPRVAHRPSGGGGFRPRGPVGQNPPGGALIDYYVKAAPGEKKEVTLEIQDSKGKVIRKYSSKEKKSGDADDALASEFPGFQRPSEKLPAVAGLNRFAWDLRFEKPTEIAGTASWGGRPTGPLVVPGMYQVKLTAAGKTVTAPLQVKLDPRLKTSQEDLIKQLDLMTKITARVSEAHDAVKQIRDLRAQLTDLKKRLHDQEHGKELSASSDQLDKKMTAVEDEIIQSKSKSSEDPLNYPIKLNDKLMALGGTVESAETAPTKQSYEVFEMLSAKLDAQLAKWKEIQAGDLAELNKQLRKDDVPNIMLAPQTHD
jgi:photosystem II stability/assembly factor-like uncharacterized protein